MNRYKVLWMYFDDQDTYKAFQNGLNISLPFSEQGIDE